jgi:hypothetical protein
MQCKGVAGQQEGAVVTGGGGVAVNSNKGRRLGVGLAARWVPKTPL